MMMEEPYRIDVHHHIVPPEYRKALSKIGMDNTLGGPFPPWSVDATLEMMDQNRIKTAITSVSAPGVWFKDKTVPRDLTRRCNEISARMVNDYPKRFGAFASLPLPDIETSMKELDYALEILKLDGVVLMTNYHGTYLGDPAFEEVFSELNRKQSVVFVHPTDPLDKIPLGTVLPNFLIEAAFETTRAIVNLIYNGTLDRYPDISFIFSHAGGTVPFLTWRISLLPLVIPGLMEKSPLEPVHCLKQLYYDIALAFTPYSLRSLQELADPSHILFGSDYPFAPEIITQQELESIHKYDGFTPHLCHGAEQSNAMKLFPRLQAA